MAAPRVDMSGRTVMVTGCTAGLGRAAALELAAMGAELALVCRNRDKGEAVRAEIAAAGGPPASLYVGDLGLQADVRRIARSFLDDGRPLHVLFNNAGVVNSRRESTAEGFETTFAVNHLACFLLTRLLLPRLRESAPARVVSTASDAHRFAGGAMDWDDLQSERRYRTFRAYGQSKLANILFTRELARREREHGVSANAFHPGFVGSDFAKNNGRVAKLAMALGRPFARSPEKGAETGVWLCSAPELSDVTGGYFYDMRPHQPNAHACNDADAARLWERSEQLTGLTAGA